MSFTRYFLLSLLLLACPAVANDTTINLPAGQVNLNYDSKKLAVLVSSGAAEVSIEAAFLTDNVEAIIGNSFLLFLPTGGVACPGLYAWVTLDENGLSATDTFGTCSDGAVIQKTDRGPMVVMARIGRAGTAGYLFATGKIFEQELGLPQAGVEDPSNASAWSGKSAWIVLNSKEMEAALLAFMSWENLENARLSSAISSDTMSEDGEWFAATGCRPHFCNEATAGVAISLNGGGVIVAIWTSDGGGKLYGRPDTALPNKLRNLLNNGY